MRKKVIFCIWIQIFLLIIGLVLVVLNPELVNSKAVLWFVILHGVFTLLTQATFVEKFDGCDYIS